MANITLRQLRYFEALARQGHFGRAADLCAISQPALSMQIRDLEAELGTPLVDRGPRQVKLTDFGEAMLLRAREILRSVDELGDLARASRDRLEGQLRIGVIPTVAPYLLPRMVSDLSRDNPEIDLHIREAVTPKLLQDLAEGRLDAAIVALPVSESALVEVPLFEEGFVLVRPPEHDGTPVPSPEALKGMPLLLLEEGHCFRDQALAFCKVQSAQPGQWMEGSSLATLVQMVAAGIGVTLIPEMAIPVETRSAAVSIGRFAGRQPSRTIGMVWRRTSPLARQLARISEAVRDSARPPQGPRESAGTAPATRSSLP